MGRKGTDCRKRKNIFGRILYLIKENIVEFVPLMELPFCCISMAARLIIRKIYEWNIDEEHKDEFYEGKGFIGELNEILNNSLTWPVAALIAMLPILAFITVESF